ncbi:MAG: aldo/keto reductase [Lachnospiraceae bacterium]|nr:aldo/keto reductase [Lachnospiraceae bacterium]
MEKRQMKKVGLNTSLLGFGCMRFPVTEDGKIIEAEAEKLLDRAIAAGVNYLDTAYPYHGGQSESFVGRVLKKYDRESLYVVTKMPMWNLSSLEDAKRIFAEQQEKLQTEYFDFYLLHSMGRKLWDKALELGVVDFLEEQWKAGVIRNFGFSFHDSYEVFEEILNYRDWDFCQIQLNYMDVDLQAGMRGYQLAQEKGIPLVIMEPIKGGSLAVVSEDIREMLDELDPKASTASFALRWVGSLPGVKVILSGMSTMEQVEDNIKTFTDFKPLTKKEEETIVKIRETMRARVQNGCTGCGYCMPCPAGVNIPENFRTWNTYHMYHNYNMVKDRWENHLGQETKPKNCIECGKCEQACPQKISIREDLKKVQEDLDKKEYVI